MSISIASQLLSSKASVTAYQGAASLLGRFVTLFQSPRVALPTLVVSTAIGALLGFFVAIVANVVLQEAVNQRFSKKTALSGSVMLSIVGSSACLGALTILGMNVGTSKLLKLPFSRSSSFAITLATLSAIALGLLWVTGFLSIACETID